MVKKEDDIDDTLAGTSGGFTAHNSESNSLFNKLSNLKPKEQQNIESNIKQSEKITKELFEDLVKPSSIRHLKNNELGIKLKDDITKTLNEILPNDSVDTNDGYEKLMAEDFLITTGKIERDNKDFDKVDLNGKQVSRRLKEIDERIVKRLMKHLLRFISPRDIEKEILIEDRKIAIKKLLLSPEEYSRYRHKFINEMYSNILSSLPKMMKTTYGVGFLREAFMIIHVIYKFGYIEGLDEQSISEIICESNDILPSTQIYDREFTIDFFLELAKEGVFKKIQKLCNEDILITQLTDMTGFVSRSMDTIRLKAKNEGFETKDLKDLTDLLTKIQTISSNLDTDIDKEQISYIYNDASVGIDYSKLAMLKEIDPDTFIPFDFKYYIQCYDEDSDGNEIFKGWLTYDLVKRKYVASYDEIKIWDVKKGDKDASSKLQAILQNERQHGDYKIYKVKKMYNNERNLVEEI